MAEKYVKIYQKVISESKATTNSKSFPNSAHKPAISPPHILIKPAIAAQSDHQINEEMEQTRHHSANPQ